MASAHAAATDAVVHRLVEQTVFTPLRQGSAVAGAVARLGQAIGMGLLRPGDRLPRETELAGALGISPVTLRNALAMLREAGLLETQRGRGGGTLVAVGAAIREQSDLDEMPSEAELRELADVRVVVEGGAAALAAERATDAQLEHLGALAAEMKHVSEFRDWSERDTLLHLIIADASGSQRLVQQIAALRAETYRISQLVPVPQNAVALADREHANLVRQLRARRPERARSVMAGHVRSTLALWLGLGLVPTAGSARSQTM